MPDTLTFNYSNIRALAGYLLARVLKFDDGPSPSAPTDEARPVTAATPEAADDVSEDELLARLAKKLEQDR